MSSMPPPAPPSMGGMTSSGAPPQGGPQPGAPEPGGGLGGLVSDPSQNPTGSDPKAMVTQIVQMTAGLDQALMSLAGIYADSGGDEVGQARQLLDSGTRKFLAKMGSAPASSPTSAGSNFPGGGFTSAGPTQ